MVSEFLKNWLRENRIDEVECLVPDLTGNARGKFIPAAKFVNEDSLRLPANLFHQTISGEYPEDESMLDPADGDMILLPDADTIRMVPWVVEPTAQVIHDCFDHHQQAIEFAPRNVLKKVLNLYAEQGLKPVVAPELEFYLVKKNLDPDYPLEPPVGRSGRPEIAGQAFSIDAVNEFDPIVEDIYDYCEAQHLEVDTLTHEVGAAQMEINFRHGDALELADQAFIFKRTVRECALRHDMYATFMAKPMASEPGSAMHIHQSLLDKTGNNVFSTRENHYTQTFLHYLGGLQHYLAAAMPFFAPNVNSYRRIARHLSAPINTHWGYDNRSVGLRIPICTPESMRVENRVAGADANPYLAIALTLGCGYLGIMHGLSPTEPIQGSGYKLDYNLPRSLEEANRLLKDCQPLTELLGARFVQAYTAIKEREYETFLHVISSWEREYLLLNV